MIELLGIREINEIEYPEITKITKLKLLKLFSFERNRCFLKKRTYI